MKQQINYIISQLRGYFPEEELRELAYWIVEETTGMTRTQILMDCKGTENIPNIEIILQKLRAHEPIQYVFGHTEWMGLDLRVSPATLIPRPETAELVDWVLALCPTSAPLRVLDIGTGSGCIALALKQRAPQWSVTGLDISEQALEIAKENALRNHLDVNWLQADILSLNTPLPPYDIIVSNPPYICEHERNSMDARVLDYEPSSALFVPNDDPLLFYRKIASLASHLSPLTSHLSSLTSHLSPLTSRLSPLTSHLSPNIHIFFEINEAYGEEMCAMLRGMGYTNVQLKQDMYGKPRMVFGTIGG